MDLLKIFKKEKVPRKINLGDSLEGFYGKHRSGWLYALKSIECLHHRRGILFDGFIERTFNWGPKAPKAHKKPWIGVIHVPPNIPAWFGGDQSNHSIFQTPEWQESLPLCRGLFVLSNYHKKNLENTLQLPINSLVHPTETPEIKWDWQRFQANQDKKILQIGWWQRKLHTIYRLQVKNYKKIFIKITYADVDGIMAIERKHLEQQGLFNEAMYDTVSVTSFLPDQEYDSTLSENIVIADLYDSSANNLVIECIVRNTPILLNPLESTVEYLGEDYPLYFNSLEEAAQKADDFNLIHQAHRFLADHPIKEKLTGDYFRDSFINSPIYRDL